MKPWYKTHVMAVVTGSSAGDGCVALPEGRLGRTSLRSSAPHISSTDALRMLRTSVRSAERGALAEAKSHFTARGKQAAIFRSSPLFSSFKDGSFRAAISHKSATASNETPDSHSLRSTACFTSLETTWA